MEGQVSSPHRLVNPEGMAPASGFSHAVVPAEGRLVFLAGQVAHDASGNLVGGTLVEQFSAACDNVVSALEGAGAGPQHLVSLHVYVTDASAYRRDAKQIGDAYRARFGRHYPAMALFEVAGLFEPDALVELVGVAVVPG